jgi:hypothetical protein
MLPNGIPQPLLMIPLRRCGSHALRLRLRTNPDFFSPYPLHQVDFLPLLKHYGDLSDDTNYFRLITDFIGFANTSPIRWSDVNWDPVSIFNSIKCEKRTIHTISWTLLLKAGQQQGAKVCMCKSLDNIHQAEELMEQHENILFLNVVRDPRGQISSINRSIIYYFDTYLNTRLWIDAYRKASELERKYPDRVLTIRFEDFINNQEEILRRICKFIKIDFLEAMLNMSKSSEAKDISKRSALWESNHSSPIKANVSKFRDYLSMEEIEVIETLTGDMMDDYGYEKITKGKKMITKGMEKQALKNHETNKAMAWADLERNNPQDYIMRKFRTDYLSDLERRLSSKSQL